MSQKVVSILKVKNRQAVYQ